MIRILGEQDRNDLLEYLNIEESLNIYILSNFQVYGFDENHLTFFGEFNELNKYVAVLLFTKHQSIFYSHNRQFNTEWLKIFENNEFSNIGGAKSVMDKIYPHFKEFKVDPVYFAEATELSGTYEKPPYDIIKVTTIEQCEKLYDLLKTIDEFVHRTKDKNEFVNTRMKALAMGSTYYIEENGKMISTVTASGETNNTAVVVMVGTAIEARNRGLASILVKYLMHEYIEVKKKNLCLFYDNPQAGNIYKRLGFKDVDGWTVLFKE